MSLCVNWPVSVQARFFLWADFDSNLVSDIPCNFALQRKDIFQLSMVALCPELPVASNVNQFRANFHLIAKANHRTFHDRVDIQFARDFRESFAAL
jgi:hypothetical protein